MCGSEMRNADSLMKCANWKRGREQKVVTNPVATQRNADKDCIPWESGKVCQFQI